jgi:hypothetical protein
MPCEVWLLMAHGQLVRRVSGLWTVRFFCRDLCTWVVRHARLVITNSERHGMNLVA